MTASVAKPDPSPWPHRAAVALACATFPLIWVGGLVTTYDAGMAVPDWPTTYGYNMFLYPLESWISGPWDLFIEHGHRLLGALVGLLTIALNIAIWRWDSRPWMRWLAAAALLLVISQGVLGGMRVRMASIDLARAHGCTGPLFFALTVVLCTTTSRFWFKHANSNQMQNAVLPRKTLVAGWLMFAAAYLQLVLGAHLRHPGIQWPPGIFRAIVLMHVVVAGLILLKAIAIAVSTRAMPRKLMTPAMLLTFLVGCQIVLGVAAWRVKYGWPSFVPLISEANADSPGEIAIHNALAGATVTAESMTQALTVTGHVALGSLILATSVWYATRLSRAYFLHGKGVRHQFPEAPEGSCRQLACDSLADMHSSTHPAFASIAVGGATP